MKWDAMQHFLLILLCFGVALAPRFIPLAFFRKRKIPKWFTEWMEFVPICLFTSLVVKDIFINQSYAFSISGQGPELIAAVLVIGIAYWTRSMLVSVMAGLAAVFLLTFVL
ncbi:AzlD domain-containing protein [Fructilactobacillus fructivorans]|uniref:Putative membrane protein n=1 Tax=Fructilactobacillus fructivorans TaxID=1614 RepID=A0A0C1LWV5_9LACO|nr:AzlD domain-containing protein [Fructilactobacillus fructivorans]KID41075.1 putative membrane protein [Fructilactobacillus fructivorans]MCT0151446.1 AzlD domain-containing protein [Fructilactobacillus fructivorans]MCT2866965.1 AzlD domain-containing protein [Fructilactobacillus fructivorans]MCT2869266.1 AzlD domain-containing protein [Fructilactobacillus fructivorans]MCT2873697.1 AzlD domain-containing protein [Fructilactobacillus fructivorans]